MVISASIYGSGDLGILFFVIISEWNSQFQITVRAARISWPQPTSTAPNRPKNQLNVVCEDFCPSLSKNVKSKNKGTLCN